MRLFLCLFVLLPCTLLAKPVEEKSKPVKPDDLQVSDVSPTTLPPAIPTEGPSHVDGEPTFEEEIARVIEGSVENMIPFGASEKPETKKADEEPPKQQENGFSVVDWFGLMFNHNLPESTNKLAEPEPTTVSTTTSEQPTHDANLGFLQMALNQQRLMLSQDNSQPIQQVEPARMEQPTEGAGTFAARYQQWLEARNMGQWMNTEPVKQDPYAAAQKSKLSWSKLMAEPISEDYKQYIPADNTVQWSSNEVSSDIIDLAQKALLIPSNVMKNKEQWFGESDM